MSAKKVAIVTGANKGLGYAIVKRLCEQYDGIVYLTSRDENKGRDACEELRLIRLDPVYHQLNVTDNESIENFVTHLRDNKADVEILINNAGILFLNDAPEPRLVQAEQTVSINYTALVNVTEAVLPFMKSGSRIVNISSSSGHLSRIPNKDLRTKFSDGALTLEKLNNLVASYVEDVRHDVDIRKGWPDSPYVVSKVAVNAYTFMLHRKLSPKDISVNCVHPGYVITDMTRHKGVLIAATAAVLPVQLALTPRSSGMYVWHNGCGVPWDGADPRAYIDGIL